MNRRRRRASREIPFSFDSFLDIVANVVGVIIRLILVVWVGARSFSGFRESDNVAHVAEPAAIEQDIEAPLRQALEEHRRELARVREELERQLAHVSAVRAERQSAGAALERIRLRQRRLQEQSDALRARERPLKSGLAAASLAELNQRRERLKEELRDLERLPALGKTLRYRTPVSQPVLAEQFMFELRQGRIVFIDMARLLAEVRLGLEDTAQRLRSQRRVEGSAGPVGPFRLRYTFARESGALDGIAAGLEATTSFRYSLNEWQVEPITEPRGETADEALAAGSAFRQVVDSLDPRQSAVTIWVYPDSFAAYRRLRDYLHDRDLVVAARPLPNNVPIAASPRGSVSRGQ